MGGVITVKNELIAIINNLMAGKSAVKVLFNQGRNVYDSRLAKINQELLYFDFDGIEETSLISFIDFGAPSVLVFYLEATRYQFMVKSSKLVKIQNQTFLEVQCPTQLTIIEGRKTTRVDVETIEAHGVLRALIEGEIVEFRLKELSSGGISMWSESSHGLAPKSHIKSCELAIGENFSIPCSIEIVRITYALDDTKGQTHLISARFIVIGIKEKEALIKKIEVLGCKKLGMQD